MKKIVLVGFYLAASNVFAVSAAKVLFTDKKVVAILNGAERVLSRGSNLDTGDEIRTADNGSINLQYSNGTLVNIGSNSTYKILAYAPKSDVQIKAELSNGKLELQNPGKIKETLKTPIVSLAILGTHIRVDVESAHITHIQVVDGLVWARNEFLRPGASVRVTGDRIVNAPFPKFGLVMSPPTSPGKILPGVSGSIYSPSSADTIVTATTVQQTGTTTVSGTSGTQAAALVNLGLTCIGSTS